MASTHVLFYVLVALVLSAFSCGSKRNPDGKLISGYELVWADEFNTDGPPDPGNWTFERGFVRNEELQWYQEQNAFCEDGLLVIEARREQVKNSDFRKGTDFWKENREFAAYTSSSVTTRGSYSWKYGILEVRAKIKALPGLWPAIWTLGIEKSWPHNGEVDVMEYYRDLILANFAWGDSLPHLPVWKDLKKPISDFPDNWAGEFHVWKMDWSADSIKLYVDDLLLNEISLDQTLNRDGSGFNPFHQPQYLILNLAIGGTQGGDPAHTDFPVKYLIDYVRVYQKKL